MHSETRLKNAGIFYTNLKIYSRLEHEMFHKLLTFELVNRFRRTVCINMVRDIKNIRNALHLSMYVICVSQCKSILQTEKNIGNSSTSMGLAFGNIPPQSILEIFYI